MPVPFPNIAKSDSLKGGSRSVCIDGAPVCLSTSCLATSTGNEAATAGGGVTSAKTKGAAHPASYSFDVKVEGKPVVRNMDLFTLNDRNTGPFPILQKQAARPVAGSVEELRAATPVERCRYCGKEKHAFDKKGRSGGSLGSSAALGRNMLEGRELSSHPWFAGVFSLAAHHLICLEALANGRWSQHCARFGYHPDRRENGVFLPMRMALACELHVAVHRGNHAEGYAFDVHLPYPKAVKQKLREIESRIERGDFCDDPEALVRKLDKLSEVILGKVERFLWTLTRDGRDYATGGKGCSGLTSIKQKPGAATCPRERRHRQQHALNGRPLARRPLRVGE